MEKHKKSELFLEVSFNICLLHKMMREGHDGLLADQVRDLICKKDCMLSEEDQELLRGLSGDLYMLDGSEILIQLDVDNIASEIVSLCKAVEEEDYGTVLRILRFDCGGQIQEYERAWFRAIVWEWLGDLNTSVCFLEHGIKLAKEQRWKSQKV